MQSSMMGQNIIITERCSSLRQLGRNALRGKWKNAILAVVIYIICMMVPQLIFDGLFGVNMANYVTNEGYTYSMDAEFYQQLYNSMPERSFLSLIYVLLMTGPLMLGLMIYFLASFRGHNVVPRDVFLGFERFGKALGLLLYMWLFVFLWTLLFIVPGIIAAIRYSQAFFVLADDPTKSITQCMNESKFMMKGNKAKYFLLSLSFIGWYILASVPGSIVNSIVNVLGGGTWVTAAASLLAYLFTVPVYVYVASTFAGFYEILAGHLIKETEPVPLSVEQIDVDAPVEQIEEVIEQVEAAEVVEAEHSETAPVTRPEEAAATLSADAEIIDPQNTADVSADVATAPVAENLPEALDEEDTYHD